MGNQIKSSQNSNYVYNYKNRQLTITPQLESKFLIEINNPEQKFQEILQETNLEQTKFINLQIRQKVVLLQLHYSSLAQQYLNEINFTQNQQLVDYLKFFQLIQSLKQLNDDILIGIIVYDLSTKIQNQIEFLLNNQSSLNFLDKLFLLLSCIKIFIQDIINEEQLKQIIQILFQVLKVQNQSILIQAFEILELVCWKSQNGHEQLSNFLKQNNQQFCLQPILQILRTAQNNMLIKAILTFINNYVEIASKNEKIQLKQLLLVHGIEIIFQEIRSKLKNNELNSESEFTQYYVKPIDDSQINKIILQNIEAFEILLDSQDNFVRESINQFRISYKGQQERQSQLLQVGNVQLTQIMITKQFFDLFCKFKEEINKHQNFSNFLDKLDNFLIESEKFGANLIQECFKSIYQLLKQEQQRIIDPNMQKQQQQKEQLFSMQENIRKLKFLILNCNQEDVRQSNKLNKELSKNIESFDTDYQFAPVKLINQTENYFQLASSTQEELSNHSGSQINQPSKQIPPPPPPPPPPLPSISFTSNITTQKSTNNIPPPPPLPLSNDAAQNQQGSVSFTKQLQSTIQSKDKVSVQQQVDKQQSETQNELIRVPVTEIKQQTSQIFKTRNDKIKTSLDLSEFTKNFTKIKQIEKILTIPTKLTISTTVLPLDRTKNIELILFKLKMKPQQIIRNLEEMQYKNFTQDDIESLTLIMPTQSEKKELEKQQNQDLLSQTEQFLKQLVSLNQYEQRIEICQILLNQCFTEVKIQLKKLQDSILEICGMEKLKLLLSYILETINFLNNKQSQGFRLSEFQKIALIKATQSKQSLLSLILKQAEKQEGELLDQNQFDFGRLKQMQKISIFHIKQQVNKMQRDEQILFKFKDQFILNQEHEQYNISYLQILDNYKGVQIHYNQICQDFCEDPTKLDSDSFFQYFTQMIETLIHNQKFNRMMEEELQRQRALETLNNGINFDSLRQDSTQQDENLVQKLQERSSIKLCEAKGRTLKSIIALKKKLKNQQNS